MALANIEYPCLPLFWLYRSATTWRGSWTENTAPAFLRWFEKRVDSGPQNWKQYTVALLVFNVVLFVFGFLVLALQPWMPLNPRGLGMLAPTTIFNTVCSFMTNTNLQHYSGDVAFSNFSQIFFIIANMFLSAAVGFCALTAIIRAVSRREDDRQLTSSICGEW